MKKALHMLVVLSVVLTWTGYAQAGLIHGFGNPLAAVPGGTQIDFESQPVSTFATLTIGNATFHGDTGNLRIQSNLAGNYNTTGTKYLDNNAGGTNTFEVDFAAPVDAFAFNFGASDFNWTMTAYNSSNIVIETEVITPSHANNNGEYWGISNSGIAKVVLSDGNDYILLDNFTYSQTSAVPEPGSLAMLGIGALSLIGYRLRRRKQAVVPVA
jgi:hypothetical protein